MHYHITPKGQYAGTWSDAVKYYRGIMRHPNRINFVTVLREPRSHLLRYGASAHYAVCHLIYTSTKHRQWYSRMQVIRLHSEGGGVCGGGKARIGALSYTFISQGEEEVLVFGAPLQTAFCCMATIFHFPSPAREPTQDLLRHVVTTANAWVFT